MNVPVRRGDETAEQWMRRVWLALKFRMELGSYEERMIFEFDHLHQLPVCRRPADNKAGFYERLTVGVIEFVAMPMPFVHHECAVQLRGPGADHQLARLGAKTHRSALPGNLFLIVEQSDYWMRRVGIEFGGVSLLQLEHVTGEFNRGDLHPQT